MIVYYLYRVGNRKIIDSVVPKKGVDTVLQTCLANSWLDAKQKFGMELTSKQKRILAKEKEKDV